MINSDYPFGYLRCILCGLPDLHLLYNGVFIMGLCSSPLAYTILPSSAGGLTLFQSQIVIHMFTVVKTYVIIVFSIYFLYHFPLNTLEIYLDLYSSISLWLASHSVINFELTKCGKQIQSPLRDKQGTGPSLISISSYFSKFPK